MAVGRNGEVIQTIEVNESSIIGTLTNQGQRGSLIHALSDVTITFHFPSGDKTLDLIEGSDVTAGRGCTGVTTTSEVLMS